MSLAVSQCVFVCVRHMSAPVISASEAHPQCILCERRAQSVANSLGWPVLVTEARESPRPFFPSPSVFLMSLRLAAGAPEQASTGHQATKSHGCHGRRSAPGTSWPYLEGDGQALLVFTSAGLLSEISFLSVPSESLRRLDRSS